MTLGQKANPIGPGSDSGQFGAAIRVLEEAIAARAFPGCAFGVLAGGGVALKGALGRFTYEAGSQEVMPETRFDIASLTKVVGTTAAAMLLVARGQMDLETRVGEIVPEFLVGRGAEDPARKVTLRHLLAHNSGLPGYVELFRVADTPEGLIRACLALPLEAEPGTRAEYSDPGFMVLGWALEVLMGDRLDMWLGREVFEPLGLAATGFCPAPAERGSIPPTEQDTWFRRRLIQGEVQDESAWVLRGVAGHAGLFSTVGDLLRFCGAILSTAAEPRTSATLFDREVLNRFTKRQEPAGNERALGWDTPSAESSSAGKYFSARSVGHLAFSGCSLWIDLDAAVTVVLLTNRTWPDRKNQMIRQVRPAFHDAVREALQK
ncbi:MAG TPA: serine hydrolase domain-containing protein [Terracidiphilus sp.]|nr:serine hydrolase domain-containing protein [Terracidiphilus sp.]